MLPAITRQSAQNQLITTNSQETLNHISKILNISIDTLSVEEASDRCFNAVYDLFQEKKWDVVCPLKKEIADLVNSVGQSLLIASIVRKDKDMFAALLNEQISVHRPGINNNLPLHYAAELGHSRFVKTLCNYNQADARNCWDQNPLHLATHEGHLKIVKHLSTHYPDLCRSQAMFPFGKIQLGLTPLALAVLKGHCDCVDFFLQKDPSTAECRIQLFGNLLHLAAAFHQNKVLELLLHRFHALFLHRINDVNDQGASPLMLAAYFGNDEAIIFLGEKEAHCDGCAINENYKKS